jgi:hypothetical protein
MKTLNKPRRARGFTTLELSAVLAMGTLLGLLAVGAAGQMKVKASRNACVNHLKETSLAWRVEQTERGFNESFAAKLGSTADAPDLQAWQVVQVSAATANPELWICPADNRKPAKDLASLRDKNLSYFISVEPWGSNPGAVLAGDRNLATNGVPVPAGRADLASGTLSFTTAMHHGKGTVALGDGSVQGVDNRRAASLRLGRVLVP